jgi:D-amino-acid dehydrogenase
VVAAGVWTRALARQLDVRLPVEAGKGYHVDVAADAGDPELPIWLHEDRVVITPLGGRIRMAGTLELTADDVGVSARRVEAIVDAVRAAMPTVADRPAVETWRGLRPCTPDGLPIIGRPAAVSNAILATGHGMWGLQLAPLTARLVAQLAGGEPPEHDLTPLRPDRFSLRPHRSRQYVPGSTGALSAGEEEIEPDAAVHALVAGGCADTPDRDVTRMGL